MSVFNTGFGTPNAAAGGGSTDLSVQATPDAVVVLSSTGADAVLLAADGTNAGVLTAADKQRLDTLAGDLSLPDFDTFADAAAAVPTGDFLRTAGFTSPGDGGGALYARVATDPGHGGVLQTADNAFWDLAELRVTPFMFGATGNGSTNDGVALQAFFDFLGTNIRILGDFSGEWGTSQTLSITGTIGSRFICGTINALGAMDTILTITGAGMNFDGTLELNGFSPGGTANYANRQTTNGIELISAGNTKFDRLWLRGFQRYGVFATTTGNNQLNLGDVRAIDCGSIGETVLNLALTFDFTARSDNGIVGPNQQSTLTTTGIPPELEPGDIVSINGRPLLIQEIAGNDLSVYPNPPAGVSSGQIVALHGGTVNLQGNDAGLSWIESISSIRCGTALRAGALYGQSVGKLHAEACGIGVILGNVRTGSARRICLEGAYFENCQVHILHTGGVAASVVIENPHLLDFEKSFRLSQMDANDNPVDPRLVGVTLVSDKIHTGSAQRAFGATNPIEKLSNDAGSNKIFTDRSSVTFQLDYDDGANRLYGLDTVEITAFGPGLENQPTGAVVIEPNADDLAAGITIDGGSSFTLPARKHPVYIVARFVVADQNWQVNWTEIAPALVPATPIADPSGGAVVDAEARTAINAILTTLRDQGSVAI
ncbi:MAG: hypothetical protein AAF415_05355 [Pseudomonadota bacterium]